MASKRTRAGDLEPLPACGGVRLAPGETVISIASGGGGYGSPLERDHHRVKHDVDEGWISPSRATSVYGVAFDAAGGVDVEATLVLRRRLASDGSSTQPTGDAGRAAAS